MKTILVAIMTILLINSSGASFFKEQARGWFWYEDPPKEKPKKKQEEPEITLENATAIMEKQKKLLLAKLNLAVLKPTPQNIRNYIEAQNRVMNKSTSFAEAWSWVVLNNPRLDYERVFPVSHLARGVLQDEERRQRTQIIKSLSENYGLFFFFSGKCAFCHHFAPIVRNFATKYGWSVHAISLDGSVLPDFPNAVQDQGAAERLGVEGTPTVLAVNPNTMEIIPIAVSMVSENELEERIFRNVTYGKRIRK